MSSAFQHMVTLLSFVLALGVSHQLLSIVEIVRAGPRVSLSWVHGFWMANSFLQVITWWFGIWDFHAIEDWSALSVLWNLAAVVFVFLTIAFVCPKIPDAGNVDLAVFHAQEHKKYVGFTIASASIGFGESLYFGNLRHVPGQNIQAIIIGFMIFAALIAFFAPRPVVQRVTAVAVLAASILFLAIGDPVLGSN